MIMWLLYLLRSLVAPTRGARSRKFVSKMHPHTAQFGVRVSGVRDQAPCGPAADDQPVYAARHGVFGFTFNERFYPVIAGGAPTGGAQTVTLKVRTPRRMPDPVLPGAERHICYVAAEDFPQQLEAGAANPRDVNIDRSMYRTVKKSLLNEDGTPNTFHLKNLGITVVADRVLKDKSDDDSLTIVFDPARLHGIANGGHSREIIVTSREELLALVDGDTPPTQFVKLEILTGIPDGIVAEIAGGLNTTIQVQKWSLAELGNRFDWMKAALQGAPYENLIAYRENQPGAEFDVRDILVILDLFNVTDFDNNGNEHPVRAYSSKNAVLEGYLKDTAKYEALAPILQDVLALYDTISHEASGLHTAAGGRGGKLAFVEKRKRGNFKFHFIGEEGVYRLMKGALFPMLGAFRWKIAIDPATGLASWQGGFQSVLDLWRRVGGDLMQASQAASDELGRNPNAMGKSRNLWSTLHSTVAMKDLMASRNQGGVARP